MKLLGRSLFKYFCLSSFNIRARPNHLLCAVDSNNVATLRWSKLDGRVRLYSHELGCYRGTEKSWCVDGEGGVVWKRKNALWMNESRRPGATLSSNSDDGKRTRLRLLIEEGATFGAG